jgi:membrane protein DedA with SNARE-associated domain
MSKLIADWVVQTMESLGYFGIGLLMFLENIFPPIPSELIMPFAGFTAAKGTLNAQYATLAGVIGTILGALPWYYAGKLVGEKRLRELADRYGKWLTLSGDDIDKANRWFYKHGPIAVLLCRLVPGVRTIISLPAGIAEMPMGSFLAYSTIGTAVWCSLLTYAGYALGQAKMDYHLVDQYLGPVSKIVLGVIVVGFVGFVWKRRRDRKNRGTFGGDN